MYDGVSWKPVNCNKLVEFENSSEKLHNANPTLKQAWEEYKVLRKLITGEDK